MNSSWATSIDLIWNSPAFPIGLTMAAAAVFALIVLVALLRADKSAANGVLTVMTLVAIGIAVAATWRGAGSAARLASAEPRSALSRSAEMPALSCIDDLAGDTVANACEKALFGSAETVAAAVSYAASQINRLTEMGDAGTAADQSINPQARRLRRWIERDRYGLIAQVLVTRDHCKPTACAAFRALTDNHQIVANMDDQVYDNMVARYAPSWNLPVVPSTVSAPVAALQPGVPTGKPTNAEFPTSASTPPVSIMTPEPGASSAAARAASSAPSDNARLLSPRPTASVTPSLASAKKLGEKLGDKPGEKPGDKPTPKPAAPKTARAASPAQLAPVAAPPTTPVAAAPASGVGPAAVNE